VSANIFTGGFIGTRDQQNGVFGVGPLGLSLSGVTGLFVELLVVAGGGGGGRHATRGAGGGGGGGYIESTNILEFGVAYPVTVGAGGPGSAIDSGGGRGSESRLDVFTAVGGGGGTDLEPRGLFGTGGSTGGAGYVGVTVVMNPVLGQGNKGGNGFSAGSAAAAGGGGGGAGGAGGNAATSSGGTGGNGASSSITGTATLRAGGGGGGTASGGGGTAGTGGGGTGGTTGGNGTANTGGGGGGNGTGSGGSGGSGVVILKIPNTNTATFSGGVTSSLSTAVSGFNVYTVTATSTTSETVTFS